MAILRPSGSEDGLGSLLLMLLRSIRQQICLQLRTAAAEWGHVISSSGISCWMLEMVRRSGTAN